MTDETETTPYRILPEPIRIAETTTGHDVLAEHRAAVLVAAASIGAPGAILGADGGGGADGD